MISTGESLLAIEKLVAAAGGNVVGKLTILAEGEAQGRDDIKYLEPLPLFHPDGTVMRFSLSGLFSFSELEVSDYLFLLSGGVLNLPCSKHKTRLAPVIANISH